LGFYIIGVPYIIRYYYGYLNLIPYVGILIAGILTILSSLGSPDLSIILGVMG
jgi:hypothetical protein